MPASTPIVWHETTQRLGYAELFQQFADTAAERDTSHRLIHAEVAALKQRGFGALRLPREQGGQAVSLPELFWLARDLATADPNIAHIFRNHFFAVEQHLRTPEEAFSRHLLEQIGAGKTLGVAFNEQTGEPAGSVGRVPATQLEWSEARQGWQISGRKIYSTGNIYADYLLATASDPSSGQVRQFFVATDAPGVHLDDDWDSFGQKLTGSGSTVFDRVLVQGHDLFDLPPRATADGHTLYGFTFHQVYLTTAVSGIANRVLADAIALVRRRQRNFYHGLADIPAQEPEIQATVGRIAAHRSAVLAVVDRAIQALEQSWHPSDDPAETHARSLAATLAASEAKIVTDEATAQLASLLIDVGSGSGVSATAALDRHWRNARVIASHNPRTYKERILGDHYLNGTLPPTGAFF